MHDILKAPLRLLVEEKSTGNKNSAINADNIQQQEKTQEVKKVSAAELEQPPQLKAYIKYPKYDFF